MAHYYQQSADRRVPEPVADNGFKMYSGHRGENLPQATLTRVIWRSR